MADTVSGRTDPFADVLSLAATPIAVVLRSFDQLRKGSEEMMRGLENFNATMESLNETAARVNRLLNDYEEPIRAMLPQLTRAVKAADEFSSRLATPIDQVVPGLSRLAETLNSPMMRAIPTDLGQFMEVIKDLSRRMSPLAQFAEQAGSMFGLRMPGLPAPAASAPAAPAAPPAAVPEPSPAPTKKAPAKRSPARKATARKRVAKNAPATKRAAARRAT